MSFLGSNKTSSNKTTINNDNRQFDNKVANSSGTVLATGGGNLSENQGSINASGKSSITVNQSDPGSFKFATDLINSVIGSNERTQANASQTVGKALESTQQLAQGTPIGTTSGWKKWATIGGAGLGVAVALYYLLRRKKSA